MGCIFHKIFKISLILLLGLALWIGYQCCQVPNLPVLDKNPWWGPETPTEKENVEIRPFSISIPQEDLDDLKQRLARPLRLTPALENSNFTYGFNSESLSYIYYYWKNTYDWKAREKRLNTYPQFKTQIEGLDIHFLHIKPNEDAIGKKKVLPLLLIHGWPGSIVEFDEIIPLLTSPQGGSDVLFEVICPSLPGYLFSQGSSKPGLGTVQTAQIFLKLMKRLELPNFYVQGGDWGAIVATIMATLYQENVLGMHVNMIFANTMGNTFKHLLGAYLPSGTFFDPEDETVAYPVGSFFSHIMRETGYFHIQSTKPDTIGTALNDSPLGLAAYILEKFSSWTNRENPKKRDGGLLSKSFPISIDRLLDNVSLYWFTQCITTSIRYYAENIPLLFTLRLDEIPTKVAAGFSSFSQDLTFSHPKSFLTGKYKNIVSYVKHPVGGHFAAMEVPTILSKDVHQFASKAEKGSKEQKSEL